jgi:hypothetical protein
MAVKKNQPLDLIHFAVIVLFGGNKLINIEIKSLRLHVQSGNRLI